VLRRFALGLLDRETTHRVGRHLLNCDACREIVVTVPDDRLLMLLRMPMVSDSRVATAPENQP
jgi:predicted anti-sigma-YlaC factor YlaD